MKKKKKKTEEELAEELVCSQCGKTNIQVKVWVDSNDHTQVKGMTEGEDNDNWCEDCEEHTTQIERQEFEKLKLTGDYEPNASDG